MTNFVLIYTGGGMPESEEEGAKVMAAWGAWYEKMGAAIVDGGNPFGPSKSVTKDGVNDGPVSSPSPTGYTIIAADSLDEAVAQVGDHPHLNYGGQVSVFETFQM
ncbi:MAG: hypothetical protein R3293_22155 [Candidatus Promineifilaceae bacterium]|nr:hypothetical protein [Candidatus Promineifilaceae bacterium]